MNRLILFLIVVLIGLSAAKRSNTQGRDLHIWVSMEDSAYEIATYDLAHCIPYPNKYCSYWTNTNFGFRSMSDSLFQALKANGYFTAHDFNKRYAF